MFLEITYSSFLLVRDMLLMLLRVVVAMIMITTLVNLVEASIVR